MRFGKNFGNATNSTAIAICVNNTLAVTLAHYIPDVAQFSRQPPTFVGGDSLLRLAQRFRSRMSATGLP